MRWLSPLLLLSFALHTPAAAGNAVEHRGVVFVSLAVLLHRDFLNGEIELTNRDRSIDVRFANRRIQFDEGGDRVLTEAGDVESLRSPLLVLDGMHYVPAAECAGLFGYAYEAEPSPTLVYESRRLTLAVDPLNVPHLQTRVEDLRPVHRAVVLTAPLVARRGLHKDTPAERIDAGTALLVRREVRLDGVPHAIVTRNDQSLETCAIVTDDLRAASRDSSLDGSHLGRIFQRLADLAARPAVINHGVRTALPRTVALTVDMCWSLRPIEKAFFRSIPPLAKRSGRADITLFMTGRWIEQHPTDMERLIELSREPGVGVTWGLHSWDHPKRQPFMNRYAPDKLRDDNLRVERLLLEWGIVPSIFYRFPGLVHDEPRLRAILDLDLISVDCDSWVASMRRNRPPHHLAPTDGSILLIHGNGNEPIGIERFRSWMTENPEWNLGALNQFISPVDEGNVATPERARSATRETTTPQVN